MIKRLTITVLLATFVLTAAEVATAETYVVERFGLEVELPEGWKAVHEVDEPDHVVVGFSLPPLWSEIEKQEISNVVSIAIYHREDITSVEEMLAHEVRRIARRLVSQVEVPSALGTGYVFVTEIKNYRYTTFASFHHENDLGFVIAFTGTDGTYETNLPKYEAFLERLDVSRATPRAD